MSFAALPNLLQQLTEPFYLADEHRNVAQWLRHKADLKLRTGVLGGKRVDYFKGIYSLS